MPCGDNENPQTQSKEPWGLWGPEPVAKDFLTLFAFNLSVGDQFFVFGVFFNIFACLYFCKMQLLS